MLKRGFARGQCGCGVRDQYDALRSGSRSVWIRTSQPASLPWLVAQRCVGLGDSGLVSVGRGSGCWMGPEDHEKRRGAGGMKEGGLEHCLEPQTRRAWKGEGEQRVRRGYMLFNSFAGRCRDFPSVILLSPFSLFY